MNPRDEDKVTRKEFRQHQAWASHYLGKKLAALRRRAQANAQRKEELGIDKDVIR